MPRYFIARMAQHKCYAAECISCLLFTSVLFQQIFFGYVFHSQRRPLNPLMSGECFILTNTRVYYALCAVMFSRHGPESL